jgi:F-type H+-transporting ATPase subunit b
MKRIAFSLALLFLFAGALALQAEPPTERLDPNTVAHGAAAEAKEIAHGDKGPKFFGIPSWILQLVNGILFVGVLWYFLRRPLREAFARRGAQLGNELGEARSRRLKADEVASEIENRLAVIETEIVALRQRAIEEGERQKQELIEAAKGESEKIVAAARNEVEVRFKQARAELTELAGELAASRARTILQASLTDADRRNLFEESVRQIEKGASR